MKKLVFTLILAFISVQVGTSQNSKNQNDKDRFITAVQFLEDEPLSETAKETRKWALRYSQDVNYPFCGKISTLFFTPEVRGEVMAQYLIKLASYDLQKSGKKYNIIDSQTAGLNSALKVYEKIIKVEPAIKYKKFDSLIEIRNKNELMKFVKSASCNQ